MYPVRVEKVKYIDRDIYSEEIERPLGPIVLKPKSYSYEKEVRAIVDLLHAVPTPVIQEFQVDIEKPSDDITIPENSRLSHIANIKGRSIRVDIKTLLIEVVIGPLCEQWVEETFKKLLKRLKLEINCTKSSIYDYPKFR